MNAVETRKASAGRRVIAFLLDFITLCYLGSVLTTFIISSTVDMNGHYITRCIVIWIVLMILVCKDCYMGVSPGRWLMRIAVRDASNPKAIPCMQSLILRNIFLLVWPVELCAMLVQHTRKRLGDLVAGTAVVLVSRENRSLRILRIILLFILICLGYLFLSIQGLKWSSAYQEAVSFIRRNPQIRQMTNGVMGFGHFPLGAINVEHGHGEASIDLKVEGATRDLRVSVHLGKEPGTSWVVEDYDLR